MSLELPVRGALSSCAVPQYLVDFRLIQERFIVQIGLGCVPIQCCCIDTVLAGSVTTSRGLPVCRIALLADELLFLLHLECPRQHGPGTALRSTRERDTYDVL